jgi:hypothetical protein
VLAEVFSHVRSLLTIKGSHDGGSEPDPATQYIALGAIHVASLCVLGRERHSARSCERLRQASEHRQVGVKLHPPHARGRSCSGILAVRVGRQVAVVDRNVLAKLGHAISAPAPRT